MYEQCAGKKAMDEVAAMDPKYVPPFLTWDYLDTRQAKVAAIKAVVARKLELFGSVGKA